MRRFGASLVTIAVAAAVAPGMVTPAQAAGDIVVSTISNRPDLISAGDAIVRVELPAGSDASKLKVTVGDRDVTSDFARRASGHIEGLITGLDVGENDVTATVPGEGARLTITNHPRGGPVFAGPQLDPWTCQEGALDDDCNQEPTFKYLYKPTSGSRLKPYDPDNPASNVDSTTTDEGVTVPFIVRVETGYLDRDQYQISALFQPDKPWTGVTPQEQFDHKLLLTHGAACGVSYAVGTAPDTFGGEGSSPIGGTSPNVMVGALSRGNVVASHALDNAGHNCNVALQAESLMMLKERIKEQYGSLRFTVGVGCSGGSLAIQAVANAYPGIYDGILPTCSFPDAWSTASQFLDYHLLLAYFNDPSKWGRGVLWLPTQMASVEDHLTVVNSLISDVAQWQVAVPTQKCGGISDEQRYNPDSNPTGVRCSIQDAAVNVFGHNPESNRYPQEEAAGKSFAAPPIDNVGVQYGLKSLRKGHITPTQFVDLNRKIGGVDIDTNPVPERIDGGKAPSLGRAYRSGMINSANNLDTVPIIDCRGPDPGLFHDAFRAFAVRDRLDREHGGHGNQLIWTGLAPILGDLQCQDIALVAMDQWLEAIEADASDKSLAEKVVDDKPAGLTDRCYSGIGIKLSNKLCPGLLMTLFGTPRTAAGQPRTTDSNKCQLKPLDRGDYPRQLTDAQFAALGPIFPDGVCDFTKPGVDQQDTVPWQTYQDDDGSVIYGGKPMDAPPVSVPFDAASLD